MSFLKKIINEDFPSMLHEINEFLYMALSQVCARFLHEAQTTSQRIIDEATASPYSYHVRCTKLLLLGTHPLSLRHMRVLTKKTKQKQTHNNNHTEKRKTTPSKKQNKTQTIPALYT